MILGDHILYNLDFFRNWQKILDGCVSLFITDPQYGTQTRKFPWDIKPDFAALAWIISQLLTMAGQVAIIHSPGMVSEVEIEFAKYFVRRYLSVLKKPNVMANKKDRPKGDIDILSVFHRRKSKQSDHTYNWRDVAEYGEPYTRINRNLENTTMLTQKRMIDENLTGQRYPSSIEYLVNRPAMTKEQMRGVQHPMQKDLEAVKRSIMLLSKPGDLIVDPFMGSGTTLVACEQTGRRGIGFDIEQKFFDEAASRVSREIEEGS